VEQRRIVARIEALFARTRRARTDLERIAALSARHRRSILAREYEGEQAGSSAQHQLVPLAECVRDFTYGTAAKCSREVDGIPVLRIPNVAAGRISLDDMKFAALPDREHRKLALEVGDILIVRSNGSPELVGRPALVEQPAAGMAFAGYLIRARPRRERVDPAYLLHMLSSPNVRGIIELNARSSSGVHNINTAELAALKVPLPSLDEQKCAVRRIEQAAAHALVWEADGARSLALLDRLEQSILARAFQGELVPPAAVEDVVSQVPAVKDIPATGRRKVRDVAA
jgi:type I restriction enzyme S subunit